MLATALLLSASIAAAPRLELKGVYVGMPRAEVEKFGAVCAPDAGGNPTCMKWGETIAGVDASFAAALHDERVCTIVMEFDRASYSAVQAALVGKFGAGEGVEGRSRKWVSGTEQLAVINPSAGMAGILLSDSKCAGILKANRDRARQQDL